MVVAHPSMEAEALAHAKLPDNGPFVFRHRNRIRVSYAMTRIPGNEGPAVNWNMRQIQETPLDALFFWRIDASGAKLLRFEKITAGANTPEAISMQVLMARYGFRL